MPADVKKLYTDQLEAYLSFNSVFRSSEALEKFFRSYDRLRPGMRILDAGCGTGTASFALVKALRSRHLYYRSLDALISRRRCSRAFKIKSRKTILPASIFSKRMRFDLKDSLLGVLRASAVNIRKLVDCAQNSRGCLRKLSTMVVQGPVT
jgi:SAM-dependent methyltransferase